MTIDVRVAPRTVLYLGQPSRKSTEVLNVLAKRPDLHIVHVPMVDSATCALRRLSAHLVLVGPEVSSSALPDLLAVIERLRPGVPVMALRPQIDDDHPSTTLPVFTMVARPCPAPVLLHLVDLSLGAAGPAATPHPSRMSN
jgi:hypothetical protein